jgi:hypothetical protein
MDSSVVTYFNISYANNGTTGQFSSASISQLGVHLTSKQNQFSRQKHVRNVNLGRIQNHIPHLNQASDVEVIV